MLDCNQRKLACYAPWVAKSWTLYSDIRVARDAQLQCGKKETAGMLREGACWDAGDVQSLHRTTNPHAR